jgi:hypothetical protein
MANKLPDFLESQDAWLEAQALFDEAMQEFEQEFYMSIAEVMISSLAQLQAGGIDSSVIDKIMKGGMNNASASI